MEGADREGRLTRELQLRVGEADRNELEYYEWCERYYGNSFSGQLRYVLDNRGWPLQKIAYLSRVKVQSLSRFNRADGDQRPGLETPTIELLWAYFGLGIERGDTSFNSTDFAAQLRSAIRASGIRPAEISRATGISPPVLSCFLSCRRNGLSQVAIERLWDYLGLQITGAGRCPGSQSMPCEGDEDMPF
jgi:hypothetical protein